MSYIQISEADRCSVDHGVHLDIYWTLFVMCVHLHLIVFMSDLCSVCLWTLPLCPVVLRWAQFFICPLMIRDAIDREVEAVDSGGSWCLCASLMHSEKLVLVLIKCFSAFFCTELFFITIDICLFVPSYLFLCPSICLSEYQLAKPSDSHRKEMLFGSLAKPGHPMGKFCWGELVKTTAGTNNTRRASLGYVQQ